MHFVINSLFLFDIIVFVSFVKMPSRESVESWNFFCDIISNVPIRINRLLRRKILFSQLNYVDRVYIATFCFQNGVSKDIVESFLWMNKHCTVRKCRKVLDLYSYWEMDGEEGLNRRRRYNAFNIVVGRICNLNGEIISDEINRLSRTN